MIPDANVTAEQDSVAANMSDVSAPLARPAGSPHRLGPLVSVIRLDNPVIGRLYAAGLTVAAVALLVIAARLGPDGRHMGTHRQLGLPPCGFLVMTSLPCPTCGMTTAFAYTVRGQFIEAIRSQAAGFVLALGTAALSVIALVATVTGRRPAINWYRIAPLRLVGVVTGLLVGAWALKIVLELIQAGGAGGATG